MWVSFVTVIEFCILVAVCVDIGNICTLYNKSI